MGTNVLLGDSGLIYIHEEQREQLTSRVSLLLCPQSSLIFIHLPHYKLHTHTRAPFKASAAFNCLDLQLPPSRMPHYAFNFIYLF